MLILVYALVAAMGLLFAYLGYTTGRRGSFGWETRFAVFIALVAGFLPLLAHDWTFLPICGPWLLGLLLGRLTRSA
jgi:hypothetical protein